MKKSTCLLLILLSFTAYSQTYEDESHFKHDEESFKYDSSYDAQLEYPSGPEVYDDMLANESTEEAYINEDE